MFDVDMRIDAFGYWSSPHMNTVAQLRRHFHNRAAPTKQTQQISRNQRFRAFRRSRLQRRPLRVNSIATASVLSKTRRCLHSSLAESARRQNLKRTPLRCFVEASHDERDAPCVDNDPVEGQWPPGVIDSGGNGAPRPVTSTATGTRQFVLLVGTTLFLGITLSVMTMVLVRPWGLKLSIIKVLRKFIKSDLARQVLAIIGSMIFVRSGLTPVIRVIREFLGIRTTWESSIECSLLRELYSPLEVLLVVAALAALAESLLPPLISVPRHVIGAIVRSIVSLTFVAAAARVVHNMKGRLFREAKWRMELEGKTTEQRRIDAIDKLLTVGVVIVAVIMGLQALGLDVNSVLAIGGVGGLAIGLAGREIFENLFSGLLIMGSRAFDVGDEVVCMSPDNRRIEGIVADVGWYRTLIRDFERELFVIPNSLFSRTVVLNVTRKGREWRFCQYFPIRVKDIDKAEAIISDIRRFIRQDPKVIQKLHKRAFLDGITREYANLYISFYVDANNRDAFLSAKQQFLLDCIDCVRRNGAEIAEKKLIVEYAPDTTSGMMEQPSFLPGDALQTMSMVDADAETILPSNENDTGHSNNTYTQDIPSASSIITSVERNGSLSSKSPGRERNMT